MEIEDNVTPEIERIVAELQKLKGMTIHVGIQNGNAKGAAGEEKDTPADILTIAGVHEFGATIKAKNVSNLAIPIADKAIGKSPRDFDGLFFIRSKAGYLFGCISPKRKGTPKQSVRPKDTKPKLHKPGPANRQTKRKKTLNIFSFSFLQWIYQKEVLYGQDMKQIGMFWRMPAGKLFQGLFLTAGIP